MKTLFDHYAGALKTTCRRILKDEEESKDIFQEGFVKIFKHLKDFNEKSSLFTWMNRIMINTALTHLRKANLIYSSIDINELEDVFVEDELEDNFAEELDSKTVLNLMMNLPDKYRIALNLFAIDGLKHNEIAEQLGISAELSRKMVSRARIKLVELIKEYKNENRRSGYAAS